VKTIMDADERQRILSTAAAATPQLHPQPTANPFVGAPEAPAAPIASAPPAPATPAGGRPGRGQPGVARIGRAGGGAPGAAPIAPQIAWGDPNNPMAIPAEFAGSQAPAGPAVHVRGARHVSGPGQGASVQMVNGRPQPGATVQPGSGVALQGRVATPVSPVAPMHAAPTAAWSGEQGIPRVAPSAATRPIADLTIILSQHMRPALLERQIRALQAMTVAPAAMACFVNPVPGVQINDGLLQGIPKLRADRDMGPWWRWILAREAATKYVLMIDDDCIPGPQWLQRAYERIELAEQHGQRFVIAAGGLVYREDDPRSTFPIGPESPQYDEQVVDVGRGAWLMPADLLEAFHAFPRLGSRVLTIPLHLATVLQREKIPTVVLAYPLDNRAVWGLSTPPDPNGSMSQLLDSLAKSGRGQPAEYHRQEAYAMHRAVGWRPLVVQQSEQETVRDVASELGPPPKPVPPPAASPTP
jgi:hypothetical protein